jgi:hypothetical protein
MQSSPASSEAFFDGYLGPGWPTPQSGAVANQVAGDAVTLHLQRLGALPAKLEVRYSPSGGTGTGSGPFAVGDFTELLINVDHPHQRLARDLGAGPGGGHIALRFTGQYESFSGGMCCGIDTLSVGPPPPPQQSSADAGRRQSVVGR